jgi:predicted dehydrogenase
MGGTHEEYVLAVIGAGKSVFCEKPLATTREACDRIIDAEVAAGRRLVMVGFMRRFDPGYQAMKQALGDNGIGLPLLFHSAHRNPAVPRSVTTDDVIVDTCVHDIDISRWLLDAEVAAVQTLAPRRSSHAAEGLQDPLLLVLEMASGALVDVETAVNTGYGYDIRGEISGWAEVPRTWPWPAPAMDGVRLLSAARATIRSENSSMTPWRSTVSTIGTSPPCRACRRRSRSVRSSRRMISRCTSTAGPRHRTWRSVPGSWTSTRSAPRGSSG